MGSLALHAEQMNKKNDIITEVLVHFDSILEEGAELVKIQAAADNAYTDDFLFEKFEFWMSDRNDEYLLFHINAFFEDRHLKSLSPSERDHTSKREEVEGAIEQSAREQRKKVVAERLSILAREQNLNTNEALASFLSMDIEQIRRYMVGENRPQRATLIKIADKFGVSLEYISGFKNTRN